MSVWVWVKVVDGAGYTKNIGDEHSAKITRV
jgi:hypothetical protein